MDPAVAILELLVANGVCATIFPTGAASQTAAGRAALAIIHAHPELFEVGNHTVHHCNLRVRRLNIPVEVGGITVHPGGPGGLQDRGAGLERDGSTVDGQAWHRAPDGQGGKWSK